MNEPVKRLRGKTALITGAAGGIGAAAAELFCLHGANVVITDLNAGLLAQTATGIRARVPGAEVRELPCDVSNDADAQRMVAFTLETFAALDVLVCNAAIRHTGTVEAASVSDWKGVFDTNVIGAANFCKAAFPALRRCGSGSIVILSSCYALIGRKEMPIYDASKAALLSLMKSLAFDGAPHNVRANAVCPGGTITPYVLSVGAKAGKSEAAMRAEHKVNSLLERRAEAIEVAYPILWLASDEASYITGATLAVDGGLSIM